MFFCLFVFGSANRLVPFLRRVGLASHPLLRTNQSTNLSWSSFCFCHGWIVFIHYSLFDVSCYYLLLVISSFGCFGFVCFCLIVAVDDFMMFVIFVSTCGQSFSAAMTLHMSMTMTSWTSITLLLLSLIAIAIDCVCYSYRYEIVIATDCVLSAAPGGCQASISQHASCHRCVPSALLWQ